MFEGSVEDRIARVISVFCPPSELSNLVRLIVRTIQAGDDIGNGLRAIPIAALDELSSALKQAGPGAAAPAQETSPST